MTQPFSSFTTKCDMFKKCLAIDFTISIIFLKKPSVNVQNQHKFV
jgi:hypothetical protein